MASRVRCSARGIACEVDRVRDRLRQVYWLGGSPCSGKSSVADLIAAAARRRRLPRGRGRRRPASARTMRHAHPCMHRWTAGLAAGDVTWDDLWMRPVDELLEEVFQCYGEQFELVVADLLHLQPLAPCSWKATACCPSGCDRLLADESHAAVDGGDRVVSATDVPAARAVGAVTFSTSAAMGSARSKIGWIGTWTLPRKLRLRSRTTAAG